MITFTLSTPDAMEALSAIQLQAGKATELAARYVRDCDAERAKIHSQRAERLARLASHMQVNLLAKWDRSLNPNPPQSPSD